MKLPLFPLNLVLFPGATVPLNIFEDRYKTMVQRVIASRERFGIALAREAVVERRQTTPHGVGTMAAITQIEEQANGNYHIVVRGEDRFRITSLDRTSEPYLVGEVEPMPDEPAPPPALAMVASRVAALFDEYFRHVVAISGGWQREAPPGDRTWTWEIPTLHERHSRMTEDRRMALGETEQVQKITLPSLPEDPSTLSFTVAAEISVGLDVKQDLLEAPSVLARLQKEAEVLTREIPLLEERFRLHNKQRFSGWGQAN
jgi:ATP-dependent Lon protease